MDHLQHRETALIDAALGHTDINQGPHSGLRYAADLELLFQIGTQPGDVCLADQVEFDPVWSRLRPTKTDPRLQPWRPISAQEHRFGHRITQFAKTLQVG